MKENNLRTIIPHPAKLSLRFEREAKSLTDKQKLKELNTTAGALQKNVEGLLQAEKTRLKRSQLKNRKIKKKKKSHS